MSGRARAATAIDLDRWAAERDYEVAEDIGRYSPEGEGNLRSSSSAHPSTRPTSLPSSLPSDLMLSAPYLQMLSALDERDSTAEVLAAMPQIHHLSLANSLRPKAFALLTLALAYLHADQAADAISPVAQARQILEQLGWLSATDLTLAALYYSLEEPLALARDLPYQASIAGELGEAYRQAAFQNLTNADRPWLVPILERTHHGFRAFGRLVPTLHRAAGAIPLRREITPAAPGRIINVYPRADQGDPIARTVAVGTPEPVILLAYPPDTIARFVPADWGSGASVPSPLLTYLSEVVSLRRAASEARAALNDAATSLPLPPRGPDCIVVGNAGMLTTAQRENLITLGVRVMPDDALEDYAVALRLVAATMPPLAPPPPLSQLATHFLAPDHEPEGGLDMGALQHLLRMSQDSGQG